MTALVIMAKAIALILIAWAVFVVAALLLGVEARIVTESAQCPGALPGRCFLALI